MTINARKRISALLVAAALVLGLFGYSPGMVHALAAEPGGTVDELEAGQSVYFGLYPQSFYGTYLFPGDENKVVRKDDTSLPGVPQQKYWNIEPLKWKVLGSDNNTVTLIAEQNLEYLPANAAASTWKDSSVRAMLNNTGAAGFLQPKFFGAPELGAIATSGLSNPSVGPNTDDVATSDKVFLLSAEEAGQYLPSTASRTATNTPYTQASGGTSQGALADKWLLRTHGSFGIPGYISYVTSGGVINQSGAYYTTEMPIRPAIRLDKSKVVLFSGASGGKTSGVGTVEDLTTLSGDSKLTLVHPDLALNITSAVPASTSPGGSISFTYTGASTGANRYLSFVLEKENQGLYYGKLKDLASAPDENGSFSLTIPASAAAGNYKLKLFTEEILPDHYSDYASTPAVYSIVVGSANASVNTSSLPNATKDYAYSKAIDVTGSAPVTLSATGLPQGLQLSGQSLVGTPLQAGSFNVTLTATASNGTTAAKTLPLHVHEAPGFDAAAVPSGAVGVPYSLTLTASGSPTPSIAHTAGVLPAGTGLSFSTGSGSITLSGTPTAADLGSRSFTFTATNASGISATKTIQLDILTGPLPPQITTASLPNGKTLIPYSETIAATAFPQPTFSLKAGSSLPVGLALAADGTISGTPTAQQTVTFAVVASNGYAPDDEKTFTIAIGPGKYAPTLAGSPLPGAGQNVPYSAQIPVDGSPAPTVSLTGGALPPGITLSPTGALLGTPAAQGTYTFQAKAENGIAPSAAAWYTIVVSDAASVSAPVFTTEGQLPTGLEGEPYHAAVRAEGKTPISYSIASGSLPPGLVMGPSGNITGTLAAASEGSYSFVVKAENGVLPNAEKSFVLEVVSLGNAAPSFTGGSLPQAIEKAPYSAKLPVRGVGPISYAVVGGTLPSGLSLQAGGALSGTPNAGSSGEYGFTVRISSAYGSAEKAFTLSVINDSITPPGPIANLVPTINAYKPDPMNFDLTHTRKGYISVSLGTSGHVLAHKAIADVADSDMITMEETELAADGNFIVSITGRKIGETTIQIAFLDDTGAPLAGYGETINVKVVNSYSPGGNNSGGSSSGGSGGGSYYSPSRDTTPSFSPEQIQQSLWDAFMQKLPAAVDSALAQKAQYASGTIRNAEKLTQEQAKSIAAAAGAIGGKVRLHADTTENGKIMVRLSLRLDQLSGKETLLGAQLSGPKADSIKAFFEKYFGNEMRFVVLAQQEAFGQTAHVAAKLEPAGMDMENLRLYAYDKATNSFKAIEKPNYFTDSNGFFHFDTPYGGTIIISSGPLAAK